MDYAEASYFDGYAFQHIADYHETAGTMQPVKEYGGQSCFKRVYDIQGARPAKARDLGRELRIIGYLDLAVDLRWM